MESTTIAQEVTAPTQGVEDQAGASERQLREPQYAVFISVYGAALGAFLGWRQRRRALPERIGAGDVVLLAVATHKASRLLAKDKVLAPIRRPFAEFEESAGPAEVQESPRGAGFRRAIGELVVCPFCLSQWVATGLAAGLVVAPRPTRFIAAILAAVAGSDFLQLAYKAGENRV